MPKAVEVIHKLAGQHYLVCLEKHWCDPESDPDPLEASCTRSIFSHQTGLALLAEGPFEKEWDFEITREDLINFSKGLDSKGEKLDVRKTKKGFTFGTEDGDIEITWYVTITPISDLRNRIQKAEYKNVRIRDKRGRILEGQLSVFEHDEHLELRQELKIEDVAEIEVLE